jgi:hypothetical protein
MSPNPKHIPMVYDTAIITLENPPMETVASTAHLNNNKTSMIMMNSTKNVASTGGKQAVPVTEQNQLRVRIRFLLVVLEF